ncbi:zinc ribbon domain-containing protein [Ornithinimicrobium sediminis]|uniref:zinc ribbon domain-containing protein n=1 Tax=Ornithinimicrobium sediminis TaxID=2904603 RepID=UPI001E529807|nr:C4-type zinc ribbon domain-containing protein [Ornithinimicrobium sediminis]
MKADPSRQARLLDLQALDTRLAQLDHRARSLPEHADAAQLTERLGDLEAEVVRTRTAQQDVQRELTKAEADVQLVRDRAERNRTRLEVGTGTARDLQGLQHELESLARRQEVLEDLEIEVMERAETADAAALQAERARDEALEQLQQVTARRDALLAEVQAERAEVAAGRDGLVGEVGADLVALYERIRAHSGTGAAPLQARRCGGCHMELNPVVLSRIKAAEEDEVLRCEDCSRILVRTDESGS